MRWSLLPVCALLCLAGCGSNSTEPPKLAVLPSKESAAPGTNKGPGPGQGKKDPTPETNKGIVLVQNLGAVDREDVRKTLDWLIAQLAPARTASPGDEAAWKKYDESVRSASGQKVSWTLSVDSTTPEGVVTAVVPASGDALCQGLRLKPAAQPEDGTQSFILEIPAAKRPSLRSGARVTVSGVVDRIDTYPRRPRTTEPYRFHVRLRDYAIVPAQ
jgi:hypothetical protein